MDIIDNDELRKKLGKLGATRLANALAYVSSRTEGGTEYVEALLLTPEEATKRFKSKLAGLKRRQKYIDWCAVPPIFSVCRKHLSPECTGLASDLPAIRADGVRLARLDQRS